MTATNDASFKTELSAEQKAHETSMDDILASIRRIIADDDALPLSRSARSAPSSAGDAAPAAPHAEAFVSLGERLTRRSAPVELETFSSPVPGASAPAPTTFSSRPPLFKLRRFAPAPDPSAGGEDQAAPSGEVSVNEASSGQASINGAAPKESPANSPSPPLELRPSLEDSDRPAEPPSASVVTLVQPSAQLVESRFKIASLPFRAPAFALAPENSGHDHVKNVAPESRADADEALHADPPPPAEEDNFESALLSPASGAKISASFEALAESLLLRDPKMIERLAREMLRPMLKEWLDDHLPDVVERLVRAEIERVARGGV